MPTTGSVAPPPRPRSSAPALEDPAGPRGTEAPITVAATRSDAAAALEDLAADLESIADRWNASRMQTATELDQVRATLAKAQTALAVLAHLR